MSLFAAIDSQGKTRYIGEVERGAACGCFCAECKSPVLAKLGTEHAWHFAHEASQERPQCLPGSINLLRRLAIEMLLQNDTLNLPEYKTELVADWRYADIQEEAAWTLPPGRFVHRNMQAAFNKTVAQLSPVGMPECKIGLWVQIGDSMAEPVEELDCVLVYRFQIPNQGEITTQASAEAFLREHSQWTWQKMPDVFGLLDLAQKRLQTRVAARQIEQQGTKSKMLGYLQQERREEFEFPTQQHAPPPLPRWVDLKKEKSSLFAFKMHAEGESWIVMAAADHPGYYVVPGTGWWDGWDEALPLSIGRADLDKGVYRGDGPVMRAIEMLRNLGVSASLNGSDARAICDFTGWVERPEASNL